MSLPDPEALYAALTADARRLKRIRRLTYRCPNRCLLLDAVAVPEPARVLMYQNRFKQSDPVNRLRSNDAGRAANTSDGDAHWLPRTFYIAQSALAHPEDRSGPRLGIQCDHVGVLSDGSATHLSAVDFQTDWAAGHAEITVRRDGSRYAVS